MGCSQDAACVIQCLSSPVNHQHTSPRKSCHVVYCGTIMGLIHSLSSGPWAYPWQKEVGGQLICLETSSPSYFHHSFSLNPRLSDVTSDLVQASFLS